ncbi:deoxyribose-phosphate aldolase [Propionicicella superfundia]|uniref:deoxyribose-phosphate aldolase n=1 Tax=Propionicicella superfundia TaxID=348582 RepID=UPI00041C87B8|nr:deoxyribose-phosphate aldolase [Propionicicella superfundia]
MVDLSRVTAWELGKCFDQSVLPKNSTETDIREGCRLAVKYNCAAFYSSAAYWTPVIVEELAGSDVLPAAAIAFPFGAATTAAKVAEATEAVARGAKALDCVMNIGALKSGHDADVREECKAFVDAAQGNITKMILETNFLTDDEIRRGCDLIIEAGIDYAKSSSGQFEGPSMEQVLLMIDACKGTDTKVKVAGVKFPRPQNAYAFLLAGVDLIGTRDAPRIIDALDQLRKIGLVPAYAGA